MPTKEQYIEAIKEAVENTTDIELLDLVYQLLTKA